MLDVKGLESRRVRRNANAIRLRSWWIHSCGMNAGMMPPNSVLGGALKHNQFGLVRQTTRHGQGGREVHSKCKGCLCWKESLRAHGNQVVLGAKKRLFLVLACSLGILDAPAEPFRPFRGSFVAYIRV